MTLAKYSIKYDKSPSKSSSSPLIIIRNNISIIKIFLFSLFVLCTLFMIYYFYIKKNDDDNIDGFETCTSCS
jgi:hypothetical protein